MTEGSNIERVPALGGSLPLDLERYLGRYPDLTGLPGLPQNSCPDGAAFTDLRPEQAGFIKLLRWPEMSSVLFWNWSGLVAARYLADEGHTVQIFDQRDEYRMIARLLCGGDALVSSLSNDTSVSLPSIHDVQSLGTVFIDTNGLDGLASGDVLLRLLIDLLNRGGTVVAARTSMGAQPLETLLSDSGCLTEPLRSEAFLALPDLTRPVLLLRERFLNETRGAWRHLARYVDETGKARTSGLSPIQPVWEMFEEYQRFPTSELPRFEVLRTFRDAQDDRDQMDFIHQAVGERSPEYWTQTSKRRGKAFVERSAIFKISRETTPINAGNGVIQHLLESEPYRSGTTVAELWLSALSIPGCPGLLELAENYLAFLNGVISGEEWPVVDLLLDNLVVDSAGEVSPIDQEWNCRAEFLEPETMFCRGIVYFLCRHPLALDRLPAACQWGPCYRDFVGHVCRAVGISPEPAIAAVEGFERMFRSETLRKFGVLEISSLLERRFGDQEVVELSVSLASAEGEVSKIVVPFSPMSGRAGCTFQFRLPGGGAKAESLSIVFPSWLGEPRFELLSVSKIMGGDQTTLIDYRDSAEIRSITQEPNYEENTPSLDARQSQQLMGVVFSLPSDQKDEFLRNSWGIDLRVAWPEMIFGPEAEERLLSRLWIKENNLQQHKEKIVALERSLIDLKQSLDLRTAELELLKSSKAWRVAELLRKIVFGWRRAQAEARNLTAIEQLAQKPSSPRERAQLIFNETDSAVITKDQEIPDGPLICVIIPVHDTPKPWLADAVNSIRRQTYPHWQLLLVNDGSTEVGTREFLDNVDDPKITKIQLTRSVGISLATQTGIDAAHGDFIALMDHDDMLAPNALEKVAEVINECHSDVIYTDETTFSDKTQEKREGYLGSPHLKPAYSPDLLLCHNYITHLLVIRKEIIQRVGGFRADFDGAQDYDLLLRVTEQTDKIFHLPEPLYHWRQSPQSTSLDTGAKPLAHLRGQKALVEALERRQILGEVLTANAPHFFRVRRKILEKPSVEIIIPFRDQPLMLRRCIDALMSNTRYDNWRVLGVDNGSVETLTLELKNNYEHNTERVRFISLDVPFNFSQIVNFGVQQITADHVVLMNNDIEVINSDWLEAMLEHSQRPEIGAVGAKLYYPNDTIQHAGIAIGIGSYAGHPHKHVEGGYPGYLNRLHNIQNVSAVTGAMMMVERRIFETVGGFDEQLFKVACNDVDFCLRLRGMGLLNLFTPYARAYHHESVSRGYEDSPEKQARFQGEVEAFQKRHAETLSVGDPYYNRNFRLDTEEVLAQPWT